MKLKINILLYVWILVSIGSLKKVYESSAPSTSSSASSGTSSLTQSDKSPPSNKINNQIKDLKSLLKDEESARFYNISLANLLDYGMTEDLGSSQMSRETELLILRQFQINLEESIDEERNQYQYRKNVLEQRIIQINNTITFRKQEIEQIEYRVKNVFKHAIREIEKLQSSYQVLIRKNEDTLQIIQRIYLDQNGSEFKVKNFFLDFALDYAKHSDNCTKLMISKLRYENILSRVEDMTIDEIENTSQDFYEMVAKHGDDDSNTTSELINTYMNILRFNKVTACHRSLAESAEKDRLLLDFDYDKYVREIKSMNYYLRYQIEILNRKNRELKGS